jgi:P27 family predicted phage terminase small subunit
MGKRGPNQRTSSQVVEINQYRKERPKPLPDMNARARAMWKRIVDSLPPDFFAAADLPLLREYCEAYDRSVEAQKAISKDGDYVIGAYGGLKAHPAIAVKTAATGVMVQLGTKLCLVRSARRGKGKDTEGTTKPKSKRGGLMFGGKQPDEPA